MNEQKPLTPISYKKPSLTQKLKIFIIIDAAIAVIVAVIILLATGTLLINDGSILKINPDKTANSSLTSGCDSLSCDRYCTTPDGETGGISKNGKCYVGLFE